MRRREFIVGLGSVATWPLAARAQQPKMPVIGYLNGTTGADQHFTAAFRQGLSEFGYVEGQNISIEYYWLGGQYDRLAALAADLVRRQAAVIVATGGTATGRAAKSATATIPIVFLAGGDPVEVGLVASLNRRGGNATGVAILTTALTAKRLELLHELVPAATPIGFLVNPANPTVFKAEMMEAETAARALRVRLVKISARSVIRSHDTNAFACNSRAQPSPPRQPHKRPRPRRSVNAATADDVVGRGRVGLVGPRPPAFPDNLSRNYAGEMPHQIPTGRNGGAEYLTNFPHLKAKAVVTPPGRATGRRVAQVRQLTPSRRVDRIVIATRMMPY